LGYYLPWGLGGSIILAVGNGLVSTFSPTTSVGKWVGYQIVMGVGRGIIVQIVSIPRGKTLGRELIDIL
jgi:hypothetical protein